MLKAARVPKGMEPPFEKAEAYVEELFESLDRNPAQGVLRIGGERYVLMRCGSLYLSWFDALAESFGQDAAREFLYNTAREIGRSDSTSFSKRLDVAEPLDRLSAGPVHFSHAGWAFVHLLEDCVAVADDSFFLHYYHPNTFESEVLRDEGRTASRCACYFSAGYSAGWCSAAFGIEVHGREIRCIARGEEHCEFVMSPANRLLEHQERVLEST